MNRYYVTEAARITRLAYIRRRGSNYFLINQKMLLELVGFEPSMTCNAASPSATTAGILTIYFMYFYFSYKSGSQQKTFPTAPWCCWRNKPKQANTTHSIQHFKLTLKKLQKGAFVIKFSFWQRVIAQWIKQLGFAC